jgi:hypothetical protein
VAPRADGEVVDLHVTIDGVALAPAAAWAILLEQTERARCRQRRARPRPAARALHVALHAAAGGGREKPLRDLARAVAQLDDALWSEAAALALRLQATPAFAAGLRRLPEGAALAARLVLDDAAAAATTAGRLKAASAPREAITIDHLVSTPGVAAKARIVADRLAPSPSYMRFRSPLARRGRRGLAAAYLWRPVSLAVRAPAAVAAWRRARRGR